MKILSILTIDPANAGQGGCDDRMDQLIREMREKNVLLDTGGRPNEMFELKVSHKGGASTITDGPFTESKEVVGGYALLEVNDRDDAIAWTNRFLDIVGDGTCYLREVISPPM